MHRPTLYLMLGYPGSGKTTAAQVICRLTGAVHIWADHERRLKFPNPTFSQKENQRLYDELNHKTKGLLMEGKSVVFDTDFRYSKDRQHLRNIAKEAKAQTQLIWLKTPKSVAKLRATEDAHTQETRILGNMPDEKFHKLVDSIEHPSDKEDFIELDGTKISDVYVSKKLGL